MKRAEEQKHRDLAPLPNTDLETCEDNVFYAEATLGTPPQNFQLLIDTGSADLWVAATDCESAGGANGGCPSTNVYDAGTSSTVKPFNGVRVTVDYVDGEFAKGPALRDTFTFGGVTVDQMEFIAADRADFWACGAEDGVLGLGPRGASRMSAALVDADATPGVRLFKQLDSAHDGNGCSRPQIKHFFGVLVGSQASYRLGLMVGSRLDRLRMRFGHPIALKALELICWVIML